MSNSTAQDRIIDLLNGAVRGYLTLETITAVILREFVVIPRADLPKIEAHHEEHVIACSNNTFYLPPGGDTNTRWQEAYMHIAVAEHADRVNSPEAVKARRRDELANEFYGGDSTDAYRRLAPGSKEAIDRIIELESKG